MQMSKSVLQLPEGRAWRKPEFQLQALIILTLLVGGGGSAYGVFNLLVQLASLGILAANPKLVLAFFSRGPVGLVVLVCLTMALPLVQLVPLPAALWSALPGRELVKQSLDLVGRSNAWFPISLAPSRTLTAFLSLIPVLAVLVLASSLSQPGWVRVLRTTVWAGIALVALGGGQILTANQHFLLYREHVNPSWLYATFANHNTSGLFFVLVLVVVITLEFAFGRTSNSYWAPRWVRGAIAGVFVIAVVLSQSRSSMGVLLIVIALGAVLFFRRAKMSPGRVFAVAGAAITLCVGALLFLQSSTRFGQSFDRFDNLEDVRPAIWSDTLTSIDRYWPVGSGISSFPEVFEVDEALENIWSFHAGRAHNDYLEIAQEAGIAGIMLVIAWAAWCVGAVVCASKRPCGTEVVCAALALLVISFQSIVDYPLRNQTVLCLAAIFVVLLAGTIKVESASGRGD